MLHPSDFATREEAERYFIERVRILDEKIAELEHDAVFLTENPSRAEVKAIGEKWLEQVQEVKVA